MDAFVYFVGMFVVVGATLAALAATALICLIALIVPGVMIWRRQRRP
jgi:hypothetical protein